MNKFLLITFVVLFVILIGEGFFLFSLKSTDRTNALDIKSTVTVIPTPMNVDGLPERAINPKAIVFRNIRKDMLVSITTTIEIKGTITEFDKQGGQIDDLLYSNKLTLRGSEGSHATYYFPKQDIERFEVVSVLDNVEKKIDINDLKVGDEIMIKEVSDPSKFVKESEMNFIMFKITRI